MELKNSKTFEELKKGFAGESKTRMRYLYFAAKADIEGYSDAASVFRTIANGEMGHAHGHLEFLETVCDPVTGKPIGTTDANLKSSIAGEIHEYSEFYPNAAKAAREEGFNEIAEWFEIIAKAEQTHAKRFKEELDKLEKQEAHPAL